MPRSVPRNEKVMFLTAIYDHGCRLEIPPRMKYSNVIDSDSLPKSRKKGENKCTKPDPSVHNIPPSHWPPKDTPILPISSSANEVWNSCTRESRRRNYRRTDNLSNRALGDGQREDQVQLDPNFSASDNYEVRRILHKLERLPPDQRKLVIDDIRPEDFSSQEYARIRAINGDRAKDYLHTIKNVFVEKGFGQAPETDDPAVLSRELKRRTRFAMLGY
ncbi:uncharacterized protein LOC128178721 [Crassostrea angulata]|uniref:uncharacterized protein LOC128178721 n=1 Tax=Magallana angulata TaxID=2784310 RepID=UPI0022B0B96E|nr:uncharacterized protein LOC128178721 [Crassostrea angulata]